MCGVEADQSHPHTRTPQLLLLLLLLLPLTVFAWTCRRKGSLPGSCAARCLALLLLLLLVVVVAAPGVLPALRRGRKEAPAMPALLATPPLPTPAACCPPALLLPLSVSKALARRRRPTREPSARRQLV